jgi:hypothetical protein
MKAKWEKLKGNSSITIGIVAVLVVLLIALFFIPTIGTVTTDTNISKAIVLLEQNNYVVFASSEYAAIKTELDEILAETRHTSYIWPEATNLTATCTASVTANTWGDWAEITDSAGNKFSDKITSVTHLSDTKIESYSDKNQEYMYQISYGASKIVVGGRRQSPIKESGEYSIDLKTLPIPAGEKVYFRCMCTVGGESCTILIRYHYH